MTMTTNKTPTEQLAQIESLLTIFNERCWDVTKKSSTRRSKRQKKEKKMFKPNKCFAAIRKDSNDKEWIALNTISGILECSKIRAQQINEACGAHWAETNPVVRFAQIEIREVKSS